MGEAIRQWLIGVYYQISEWITNPEIWLAIAFVVLKIILIYMAAKIVVNILKSTIERIFKERSSGPIHFSEKRSKTLITLLNNITRNVIYFIAIIMILSELGFPILPLLAGAGVLGLAIGFGAQNLVRDVITGFFIIYEDQFSVGDVIKTSGYTGTVQEIGLRVTKIKEWTGELYILPNGTITELTNFSRENSIGELEVAIAYQQDISQAEDALAEILDKIYQDEDNLVGPPVILGVEDLAGSKIVLKITVECLPMTHLPVLRRLRKGIKEHFEQKEIEIV